MPLFKNVLVLGRACPEPLKDGRVTVCLAGWHENEGFIRIYPTRYDSPCHQWDYINVELEKNENDTRAESWKIAGSKKEWESLAQKIKVMGKMNDVVERRNFLGNLVDECVSDINQSKRSLGIIKPIIQRTYFATNPKYGEIFQLGLPNMTELDEVKVKRDFSYEPRLTYSCSKCKTESGKHDQQILEWGFYEWMRKNPENKEQVWQNAKIGDPARDHYLLVGNQAAHRTSFMIISLFRVPKGEIQPPMFPYKKWNGPEI